MVVAVVVVGAVVVFDSSQAGWQVAGHIQSTGLKMSPIEQCL